MREAEHHSSDPDDARGREFETHKDVLVERRASAPVPRTLKRALYGVR